MNHPGSNTDLDLPRKKRTLGIALAPVTMIWMGDISVLVARGKYRRVVVIRLLHPMLILVGVAIAVPFDAVSVELVIIMNIAATVCAAIVGAVSVAVSFEGERAPLGGLLKRGLDFSGSSVAEAAPNRLEQLLSLPILGSFEAGIYSVAEHWRSPAGPCARIRGWLLQRHFEDRRRASTWRDSRRAEGDECHRHSFMYFPRARVDSSHSLPFRRQSCRPKSRSLGACSV
ncbi:MAG: hypothetical protein ACSLFF_00095 [Solirubrobacterales bacterium]